MTFKPISIMRRQSSSLRSKERYPSSSILRSARGQPAVGLLVLKSPVSGPSYVQRRVDVCPLLSYSLRDVIPEHVGVVRLLEDAVDYHVHSRVQRVGYPLDRQTVGRSQLAELVRLVGHGLKLVGVERRTQGNDVLVLPPVAVILM